MKLLTEPTLDHIDFKLTAWLIGMVLIGLIAGTMLTRHDNQVWRARAGRSARSISRTVSSRRKISYN